MRRIIAGDSGEHILGIRGLIVDDFSQQLSARDDKPHTTILGPHNIRTCLREYTGEWPHKKAVKSVYQTIQRQMKHSLYRSPITTDLGAVEFVDNLLVVNLPPYDIPQNERDLALQKLELYTRLPEYTTAHITLAVGHAALDDRTKLEIIGRTEKYFDQYLGKTRLVLTEPRSYYN